MGCRAYLLLKSNDGMSEEELEKGLTELEGIPEVEFVDPVTGCYDAVITVEASVSVDVVAKEIEARGLAKELEILRVPCTRRRRPPISGETLMHRGV